MKVHAGKEFGRAAIYTHLPESICSFQAGFQQEELLKSDEQSSLPASWAVADAGACLAGKLLHGLSAIPSLLGMAPLPTPQASFWLSLTLSVEESSGKGA